MAREGRAQHAVEHHEGADEECRERCGHVEIVVQILVFDDLEHRASAVDAAVPDQLIAVGGEQKPTKSRKKTTNVTPLMSTLRRLDSKKASSAGWLLSM